MGYNTKTHHKLHSKALESKLLLVWDLDLISKLFLRTSQVRRVKVKHCPPHLRVCLDIAYLLKTENLLLKTL